MLTDEVAFGQRRILSREEVYVGILRNCQSTSFENNIHENPFHQKQLNSCKILPTLSIFTEVGMAKLVSKSKELTSYLLFLLNSIDTDRIEIITPNERGCQISIKVKNGNKKLFDVITKKGVIADWREPDVIRVAPVPLYNSFTDVFTFYDILKEVL